MAIIARFTVKPLVPPTDGTFAEQHYAQPVAKHSSQINIEELQYVNDHQEEAAKEIQSILIDN